MAVGAAALLFMLFALHRYLIRARSVYLMEYAVYKAPNEFMGTVPQFAEGLTRAQFSPEAVDFMMKIVQSNGLGPRCAVPPHYLLDPPATDHRSARHELELVFFACVDELLQKSGLKPTEIDVLITNCSLFNPIPSMACTYDPRARARAGIQISRNELVGRY